MTKPQMRFATAVAAFDAANAQDPHVEPEEGTVQPKELLYARRMSAMLDRFAPDASETVRLAVRCQHIRRWEIPRERYPRSPEGYKAWRRCLMDFHAETAGRILHDAGYDEATVARVQSLLRKERLKLDPESQLVEDVVGLVFLQHYLERFVAEHRDFDQAKLAGILRKTWLKMSPRGREAVTKLVAVPAALAPTVEMATAQPPPATAEAPQG